MSHNDTDRQPPYPSISSFLKIQIDRPVYYSNDFLRDKYQQSSFDRNDNADQSENALSRFFKRKILNSLMNVYENFNPLATVIYFFPIVSWLPECLNRKCLLADVIAGFTILALQIPQGLAYSRLAGVEPGHGLSVSLFAPLLYALFGQSRHISVGTYAVVSIVCRDILERMSHLHDFVDTDQDISGGVNASFLTDDGSWPSFTRQLEPVRPIDILCSLSLLVGLIQLAMCCLQLGILGSFLTDNIISAFCCSSAFHAFTSQIYGVFGVGSGELDNELNVPSEMIRSWYRIAVRIPESNIPTVIMSAATLAILIGCKYWLEPWIVERLKKNITIPIELLVVVFLTLISSIFKMEEKHSMEMIPKIEFDFDALPHIPRFDLWPKLIPDAILLTFITYVSNYSLSKIYAEKHEYTVDANQELYALGMTNSISALLFCFPSSASLSRSLVQEKVGGKTQLASIVSSGMMFVFILYLSSYLEALPKCALSTIIIVALMSALMKFTDAIHYWRQSPLDGLMWIVTFILVTFVGVDSGLIASMFISVALLLYRLAFPSIKIKAQFLNTECYVPIADYKKNSFQEYSGILIFEFNGPIFYLNVQSFRHKFESCVLAKLNKSPSIGSVVLDCSSITYIDEAGVKMLTEVQSSLLGTEFLLASVSPNIITQLIKFNYTPRLRTFLTVHDAIRSQT